MPPTLFVRVTHATHIVFAGSVRLCSVVFGVFGPTTQPAPPRENGQKVREVREVRET